MVTSPFTNKAKRNGLNALAIGYCTETQEHVRRVQHYAGILTEQLWEMGHPEVTTQLRNYIVPLAAIHDIGKLAISPEILTKPGKLSRDEFRQIQTHTTLGADMLENMVDQFVDHEAFNMARDIVIYHHERYDSLGYPHGIRGGSIPFAARIVALADVFDALSSKRCYKDEYQPAQCRTIIAAEMGRQFDPSVVSAFYHCEEDMWSVRRELDDAPARDLWAV
ncbi:HD-GYP domain-containing protein [Chrysiogenes arsenatis]|uniref:HD-GYP domain-containing protein n=1 Tax=Chrysiogenes arsenatis TaxID=309797 RepID=UPI00040C867E|nr:HD domain-containing phosphohydrolase [Chrysiogenes arsenatis]